MPLNPLNGVVETSRKHSASSDISAMEAKPSAHERLEAARSGCEESLEYLMREFSPLVHGVALRITRCEAHAEDVLQDVFVGLPEALKRFDGGNLAGWLKVVATRRALMVLRSEGRRRNNEGVSARSSRGYSENQILNRIMIDQALDSLASHLRTVFVLKEEAGLTHKEIATALGISENLSQVRLYRARRALRVLLS